VILPENVAPFLNPGRLVYMKDGAVDWGWGILTAASRQKIAKDDAADGGLEEENEPQWVLDVFLPCEPGSLEKQKPCPPASAAKCEGQVVPMALTLLSKISKIRSNMPEGDAKGEEARRVMLKTLTTIKGHKKFKATGIPELDPVDEMNIKGAELTPILDGLKDLEGKKSASALKGNPKLNSYYV